MNPLRRIAHGLGWRLRRLGKRLEDTASLGEVAARAEPQIIGSASAKAKQAKRFRQASAGNIHDGVDLIRDEVVGRRHHQVLERIRNDSGPISVAFVVNQASKWNAGTLLELLEDDESFRASVVLTVVPYAWDLPAEQRRWIHHEQTAFYRNSFPHVVDLYDAETDTEIPLEDYSFDIVFPQQPWGMRDLPRRLLGRSLCVYFHYGFAMMDNSDMHSNIDSFHSYIWLYCWQTEIHRRIHIAKQPTAYLRGEVVPYPKFDDVRAGRGPSWADVFGRETRRRRVIFAPHHSLGPKGLAMATFAWSGPKMLEIAEANPNIEWLLKPHPMLAHEVQKNGVMSGEQFEAFLDSWDSLENTARYESGDYFGLFSDAQLLVTDSGSFLAEFLVADGAIVWLDSEVSVGLNRIGVKLSQAFHRLVQSEADELQQRILQFLDADDLKPIRDALANEIAPVSGTGSEHLLDLLRGRLQLN